MSFSDSEGTQHDAALPFSGLGNDLAMVQQHALQLKWCQIVPLRNMPVVPPERAHTPRPCYGYSLLVTLGREIRGR